MCQRAKVREANACILGAAAPTSDDPSNGHILLHSTTHIKPMFVQVTMAIMMAQQDKAQGFQVAVSKAQYYKASGTPSRGQVTSPQRVTSHTAMVSSDCVEKDKVTTQCAHT